MGLENKQFLYEQYLTSHRQVLDMWFVLKMLYSKLAKAYDNLSQKFFEKPRTSSHMQRYCIIKQYKIVCADLFAVFNRDFFVGREFSEPLFCEKSICEYYTPEKMCIVNGCGYHQFNKQYFDALQNFQAALNRYQSIVLKRDTLYNKILLFNGVKR